MCQAYKTPVQELLRAVPFDARIIWTEESGLKATHMCPIGKHSHDAADMIEHFQAENQRLREELAKREWQPIETAPKGSGSIGIFDRSLPDYEGAPDLLLVCDGEVKIGCYEWCHDPVVGMAAEKAASPWISEEGYAVHPTHWMQLPAPPKEDA